MTSRPNPSTTQASEREGFRGGIEIPGWELFYSGKVRDLYRRACDPGRMLMVATDRLSAFDVVFAETIPDRGRILTHITEYWVSRPETRIPCARITVRPEEIEGLPARFRDPLRGRVTLAHVADRIDVEVVLRARLAGSGWREYEKTGTLWGQPLPAGLQKSSPLPGIFLTPTTKAEKDEPISWERAIELIGDRNDAARIREMALELFETAARSCRRKRVILADTKFEFGRLDGKLVL
ncbi:MAG: phosphoribosylaminoimidazolesuccinocarboxamide synthase, partial [Planctomycetota bacterium]